MRAGRSLSSQRWASRSARLRCTIGDKRGPVREELALLEVAADISKIAIEHQRAQEALRRSEERNRAILRAIPDWIFILSAEGEFLDYHVKNPANCWCLPTYSSGRESTKFSRRSFTNR